MIFLCYHGVTSSKSVGVENFSNKHITINEFYKQMLILKKNYSIIDIQTIHKHIKHGIPFKKNNVAISFDDGFENNFTNAAKILKKLKIPAIFYICPESISNQEMFWVDKIEACINHSKINTLILKINKKNFRYSIKTKNKKKVIIQKLKNICKKSLVENKDLIIQNLIQQTKVYPETRLANNYKIASWKKIRSISKNKLFSIGGHSLSHDIFTKMSKEIIKHEISETIKIIKKKLGIKIKHFSYPEGKTNRDTINFLKKNNILTCPIAKGYKNNHLVNPYKIKRVMVGFSGTKFPLK
jgi:peptidoglycan/xylan/chitin deacetylase (PgdA/CDA1 family)